MTKLFSLMLSAVCISAFSQSKVLVKTAGDNLPVQNASISCNNRIIGKTDASGTFSFRQKCADLKVYARGFYTENVVQDKLMEVILAKEDPKTGNIETIVLDNKSDPRALEILNKVNANYRENSPQSLDSYSFKSYEKVSLDLDEDSIRAYQRFLEKRIDSLEQMPTPLMREKQQKDSVNALNLMKLAGQSKLFLWERATENLYSKKYGEKINILDNKIAGLNEPIYELIAFRSNRNKIPREIQEENRNLYRFFLTDSIVIDGRKNYVIRFRQVDYKEPVNRRKYNGYLYIDADTYALKKIESNSKIKNEGTIVSIWKPINNKWFLEKENFKIKMPAAVFDRNIDRKNKDRKARDQENADRKKYGIYAYVTADYFDIKTPIEESASAFKGYTINVQKADGTSINQYRTEPLTARERNSYEVIDSVSNTYKLDRRARFLSGILKGKYRTGMFDIDLADAIGYNKYEHIRIGLGVKLNDQFHRYISPDAYIAYGIYDRKFKFGVGVDIRTTLEKNSVFRAEYFNDVAMAGRFSENQWNFRMKLMNSGVALNNNIFYGYEGFRVSYENDLTNELTVQIAGKHTQEEAKFIYNYNGLGSDFDFTSSTLSIKYAPKAKNIMTPNGKYTFEEDLPQFFLNYEQGFQGLGGDFNFSRMDALVITNFKSKVGVTGIRLYGGLLLGDAPIWKNFTMNGLGKGPDNLNLNLASYLGFATMQGGKYFNDKFIGTYFTHRIPWYFRSFGKNVSSFDVIYRGTIGDMKNKEYHQFEFEKLDHLYNEVGLEWNNFLSTRFNLGFFYRVGHYRTDNFKDNFAIQFKLKLLGF